MVVRSRTALDASDSALCASERTRAARSVGRRRRVQANMRREQREINSCDAVGGLFAPATPPPTGTQIIRYTDIEREIARKSTVGEPALQTGSLLPTLLQLLGFVSPHRAINKFYLPIINLPVRRPLQCLIAWQTRRRMIMSVLRTLCPRVIRAVRYFRRYRTEVLSVREVRHDETKN